MCAPVESTTAFDELSNEALTFTTSLTFAEAGRVSASECQMQLAAGRLSRTCEQSLMMPKPSTPVSAHCLLIVTPLSSQRGRTCSAFAVARTSAAVSCALVTPTLMDVTTVFSSVVRALLLRSASVSVRVATVGLRLCASATHSMSMIEPAFPMM